MYKQNWAENLDKISRTKVHFKHSGPLFFFIRILLLVAFVSIMRINVGQIKSTANIY